MEDAFALFIGVVSLMVGFVAGLAASENVINSDCKKTGAFNVQTREFVCERRVKP